MIAFHSDVVGVPLIPGIDHPSRREEIGNTPGTTTLVGPVIVNIGLVGVPVSDIGRIADTHEYATVSALMVPEFQLYLKVSKAFFGDKVTDTGRRVSNKLTIFDTPVGIPYPVPSRETG